MNLKDFEYVKLDYIPAGLVKDIEDILCTNGKSAIWKHVLSVAQTSVEIANFYSLDIEICKTAAYLHDISAVIQPNDMLNYIKEKGEQLDLSEEKYPFLLHQRISKEIAKDYLKISNEDVLSAICHHTTLKNNPSVYDMVVFIADKLSWDQDGVPPYYEIVKNELEVSLERSCLAYINYVMDNEMILYPHKWLLESREFLSTKCKRNEDLT